MIVVRLDNPRSCAGPGTVVTHVRDVQEYLALVCDRDGARDERMRLWGGDGTEPIGLRVVLAPEPAPEEVRAQFERLQRRDGKKVRVSRPRKKKLVNSPFEAALRARVNRIFTLANKLTGVDWTMVADGTHIALPSIAPFAAELRLETARLVELLDKAAERAAKRD